MSCTNFWNRSDFRGKKANDPFFIHDGIWCKISFRAALKNHLYLNMKRHLLKSKIMNLVVTESDLEYEGSLGIPKELMEKVDLWQGEKILVANKENGNRFETYAIPTENGEVILNGAAARLGKKGDRLIVIAFTESDVPVIPKKAIL
jgi:aspartate 1-decarboxylase